MTIGLATGCRKAKNNSKSELDGNNNSSENNESKGIAISEVVYPFRNGYAFVKGADDKYYIINEDGKSSYQTDSYDSKTTTFSNGYLTINGKNESYILDYNGKEVLKGKNKTYGQVSKSGYVSVITKEESISGTKNILTFQDLKGKEVYKGTGEYEYYAEQVNYVGDDVFLIQADKTFVNVKTGEKYISDESYIGSVYIDNNWFQLRAYNNKYITYDLKKVVDAKMDGGDDDYVYNTTIISDKYLLGIGAMGGNSGKTVLFNYDGQVVKRFSDLGEINKIFEYDGIYYVVSNTNYFYTMDSNLNILNEPQKDKYSNIFGVTTKGILAYDKGNENYIIIDKDLKEVSKLENMVKMSNYTFEIDSDGKFIYGTSRDDLKQKAIYSIDKQDIIEIQK